MNKSAPLHVLALVLLLAGCACLTGERPMGGKASYKPDVLCKKNGTCDLVVAVSSCDPSGSGISVPDLTGVEIGAAPQVTWYLVTDGYEFAPVDAIKFKTDGWQNEFSPPTGNAHKWMTKDKNSRATLQEYQYSVTVVKKGGVACATKDPTIVNGL
ncbi:MAG TPA: hypothetical protein VLT89_09555 [Usitatibacter sp.]|nr:hypothetical protein [Usitatibacter sp.]